MIRCLAQPNPSYLSLSSLNFFRGTPGLNLPLFRSVNLTLLCTKAVWFPYPIPDLTAWKPYLHTGMYWSTPGITLALLLCCYFWACLFLSCLPIVFLWPVGSSCRLYCCLSNRRFRYLLASILLGDLDLQMVRHVLIRVGHACTHGSQIASLW